MMYNLDYTPTTLGVQSWREIISGGTRTKKVKYHWAGRPKNQCSIPSGGSDLFLFATRALVLVYTEGCFSGVKRSRREADHMSSSSAEIKNAWS
jgi:hypothetical protein